MANKVTTKKSVDGIDMDARVTLYLSQQEYFDLLKIFIVLVVPDQDLDDEKNRAKIMDRFSQCEESRLKQLLYDLL